MHKALIISMLAFCIACTSTEPYQDFVVIPGTQLTPEIQTDGQGIQSLPLNSTLYIQYSGDIDIDQRVDVYNLDLFDTDSVMIRQLHKRGIFVMCYFSAGSFEDWRADAALFPKEILGNDMEGWPGEIWLDIRQIDLLEPIIQLTFNIFLSNAAHERGLAIGLKNDLSQIPDLFSYFEWALNEECFSYKECDALSLFIQAGETLFVIAS